MEPGENRFQTRIQGLLKKIKPEQIRSQVAGWQSLWASASTKLLKRPEKGKETSTADTASTSENELPLVVSSPATPEEKNGDNSSTDTCDTCVMVVKNDKTPSTIGEGKMAGNEPEVARTEPPELSLLSPVEVSPRNKSPVTVQQWVDSLPVQEDERRDEDAPPPSEVEPNDPEVENLTLGAEAEGLSRPCPPTVHITSCGGGGASDAGSHCSSMESLLEARKPDPEEILLELGFGGPDQPDMLSRIPSRFLQPSQLKGVAIDDFLRHQQHLADTFQSGFSGYRGLTGPSHSMPSGIVGKIMERLREAEVGLRSGGGALRGPAKEAPRFAKLAHSLLNKLRCVRESVLSEDNRRWLQSQGSRSPEPPAHRRIIFGSKSFTFAKDGDLVEAISPNRSKSTSPVPPGAQKKSGAGDNLTNEDDAKDSLDKEQLELEYKCIAILAAQLSESGEDMEIGTEEDFLNLSAEERREVEVTLIERALFTYERRLDELELRSHLRHLVESHITSVSHLLTASPSLLSVLTQMTTLLRHQEALREKLESHHKIT